MCNIKSTINVEWTTFIRGKYWQKISSGFSQTCGICTAHAQYVPIFCFRFEKDDSPHLQPMGIVRRLYILITINFLLGHLFYSVSTPHGLFDANTWFIQKYFTAVTIIWFLLNFLFVYHCLFAYSHILSSIAIYYEEFEHSYMVLNIHIIYLHTVR